MGIFKGKEFTRKELISLQKGRKIIVDGAAGVVIEESAEGQLPVVRRVGPPDDPQAVWIQHSLVRAGSVRRRVFIDLFRKYPSQDSE